MAKKQDKSGLWNQRFGEVGATLKALEDAGVSEEMLKKIRSNKVMAQEIFLVLMLEKPLDSIDVLPGIEKMKIYLDGQKDSFKKWRDYYKKQEVIHVATDETVEGRKTIKMIAKNERIDPEDVAFIIFMPISFMHFDDFKNNMLNVTARLFFLKNGRVTPGEHSFMKPMSYAEAFDEVVKRVTGFAINETIPDIPDDGILSREEEGILAERVRHFNGNLNDWMLKFGSLPAVGLVERYDLDSPGRLATINVKTNFPSEDRVDFFTLNLNNEVEYPEWGCDGEPSDLYVQWRDAFKGKTYQDLYEALLELSNSYINLPPADGTLMGQTGSVAG